MTIERKVGMGIAGQPSGGATDVADVFSTYLYTGNNSTQTITNGIDLTGEGGLLWIKDRLQSQPHFLVDTERGSTASASNHLVSSSTAASSATANEFGGFTSTGFNLVAATVLGATNLLNKRYASFTFRKKEKFFDVVTWTGNDTAGRTIPHNLGSVPAMMIVKMTNGAYNWNVYHSGFGATKFLELNTNNGGQTSSAVWNNTAPTDSVFTVGNEYGVNQSGKTYVAYLFADNSSEDAEEQMIDCGSFVFGPTSNPAQRKLTLSWEPQFLLVKRTDGTGDWILMDTMRGLVTAPSNGVRLRANLSNAEESGSLQFLNPTELKLNLDAQGDYIYMAIRAPMMKEPEAATDVFHIDTNNNSDNPAIHAPFPIDTYIYKDTTGGAALTASRLTQGERLQISSTGASSVMSQYVFDYQNAAHAAVLGVNLYNYAWKRAKGYFDVVCYKGNGVGGRTQAHSLGVAPEMMWVRRRDGGGGQWMVYHTGMGNTSRVIINSASQLGTNITYWNNTSPTDSVFTVGSSSDVNASNLNFISYHFATLDGISKVGSYTGNGSNQTIDCGFSAGSRFILIRRTNVSTSNWYIWDSVRGIVAGNDPHYNLNDSTAQVTNDDSVDPHNSGFIVNQVSATNINVSSHTYIFYAIA